MQARPVIRSICLPTKFQCLYLPTSTHAIDMAFHWTPPTWYHISVLIVT